MVGISTGSLSAFFLAALEWVTQYRTHHEWIIALLPIGGLAIGLLYYYYGKEVLKGNNQLLEEYYQPQQKIPFKMAPLVLIGTLLTHLFGGSAGREGTAVQMGGAIADQFTAPFKLNNTDRKIILVVGISAGFAAVFGTPITAAIFALEILLIRKIDYKSIFPSFLVAYIAHYTVGFWQIHHTHYSIPFIPEFTLANLGWISIIGISSGLAALLFAKTTHFWTQLFTKIKYAPLRPFIGGIVIAIAVYALGTTQYIGLGIPEIQKAFVLQNQHQDFLLKILFTSFTLGAGFKGGEVTPLFYIGATLGSALSFFIPLPITLLAGMGFVAVFSGATNTPLACTLMGMELFGYECGLYVGIACFVAYFCSGSNSIYHAQLTENSSKKRLLNRLRNL